MKKILGICGSLRKKSYNFGLLKTAKELVPENTTLEIATLEEIPLFNEDEENPLPNSVKKLKEKIKEADCILIATPEYNYSISGVLKNAIDWTSRPYGDNSWNEKVVGIMGASIGALGTARAQYHLRQIFVTLNIYTVNQPEIMIGSAQEKFNENNILIDPKARKKIQELITRLMHYHK